MPKIELRNLYKKFETLENDTTYEAYPEDRNFDLSNLKWIIQRSIALPSPIKAVYSLLILYLLKNLLKFYKSIRDRHRKALTSPKDSAW